MLMMVHHQISSGINQETVFLLHSQRGEVDVFCSSVDDNEHVVSVFSRLGNGVMQGYRIIRIASAMVSVRYGKLAFASIDKGYGAGVVF